MKERPILMATENVKTILEGRKTQTRREIKPTKQTEWLLCDDWDDSYIKDPDNCLLDYCPYGQVGDRLWVRETWRYSMHYDGEDCPIYKADNMGKCGRPSLVLREEAVNWKPSIFMPKKYARIWLEITEVRVERVQEITEDDCKAEGVNQSEPWGFPDGYINSFAWLWDSLNAKRGYGWESNPWVWVIYFREVKLE